MAERMVMAVRWMLRHAATMWAALGIALLLISVGQVRALVGWANWHFDGGLGDVLYQAVVYVFTPLGCVLGLAIVEKLDDDKKKRATPRRRKLEEYAEVLDRVVGEQEKHREKLQVFGSGGLAILGVALMLIADGRISRHGSVQVVGVFLVLGVWFVPRARSTLRAISDRMWGSPDAAAGSAVVTFTVARAVSMAFIGMALSEVNWWLIDAADLPYRVYSYIAVLYLTFIILLVARVLDTLHNAGVPAVRLLVGLVVGLVLVAWPPGTAVGEQVDDDGTSDLLADRWFPVLRRRLDSLDPEAPAVVIAASGGGSRAALFASLVYEEMSALTLGDAMEGSAERTLADQVLLISSVSGGSLASAYFAAPPEDGERRGTTTLFAGLSQVDKERLRELADRPFQEAMATDFMAPLLHGVLTVGEERGVAVSTFWEQEFGWSDLTNMSWGSAAEAPPPLVLFNATDASTGRRTVIGFPRVSPGLLAPYAASMREREPRRSLSLAEAVRVSANFPWGFDLAMFHAPSGSFELTDGGVLDNTGLDTLAEVFGRLQRATCDAADDHHGAATEIMTGVLERGLVVVEIDAGARPGEPGWFARMIPAVLGPANALQRAAHVNAGMLRRRHLRTIREATEGARACLARDRQSWSALPIHVGFVRAGLTCEDEVMTAWALSTEDMTRLLGTFRRARPRLLAHTAAIFGGVNLVHAPFRSEAPLAHTKNAAIRASGALADYSEQVRDDDEGLRKAGETCEEPPEDDPGRLELRVRVLTAGSEPEPGQDVEAPVAGEAPPDPEPGPPEPPPPPATDDGGDGGGDWAELDDGAPEAGDDPPPAEPSPPEKACEGRRAWVYLGEHDRGQWTRSYFRTRAAPQELVGATLRARGTSMLRQGPPSTNGEIARSLGVLPKGGEVCVERVQRWEGTSFVWARVRYDASEE